MMQGGKALVRPTTLAGRMRRRLTTAPRPSSPTRLQLFLPRSIPRTAICIWFLPSFKSPATITWLAEGAGHPINFLALVEETAAKEAPGKPIEIWFQDEARIGQKNKVTRRWAKRGTRPSAPHDQTSSAYIFGAICPAEGKGAGLVLPSCNSEAMALHLEEISLVVAPGAHAILLLDQAGWHVSKRLSIPDNITLLPLPPKSPELNPVENIWQFMRDNWLSNRIFKSHDDILDHCCFAWNKLIDMPWKIMSIGTRDWVYRS